MRECGRDIKPSCRDDHAKFVVSEDPRFTLHNGHGIPLRELHGMPESAKRRSSARARTAACARKPMRRRSRRPRPLVAAWGSPLQVFVTWGGSSLTRAALPTAARPPQSHCDHDTPRNCAARKRPRLRTRDYPTTITRRVWEGWGRPRLPIRAACRRPGPRPSPASSSTSFSSSSFPRRGRRRTWRASSTASCP